MPSLAGARSRKNGLDSQHQWEHTWRLPELIVWGLMGVSENSGKDFAGCLIQSLSDIEFFQNNLLEHLLPLLRVDSIFGQF